MGWGVRMGFESIEGAGGEVSWSRWNLSRVVGGEGWGGDGWVLFCFGGMRGMLGMVVLFHLGRVLKHSAGRVELDEVGQRIAIVLVDRVGRMEWIVDENEDCRGELKTGMLQDGCICAFHLDRCESCTKHV